MEEILENPEMAELLLGGSAANPMDQLAEGILAAAAPVGIGLLVSLIISILLALQFYKIAKLKGHAKLRYFFIPFLFGIMGWILVAALPDRSGVSEAPKAPVITAGNVPVNPPSGAVSTNSYSPTIID